MSLVVVGGTRQMRVSSSVNAGLDLFEDAKEMSCPSANYAASIDLQQKRLDDKICDR